MNVIFLNRSYGPNTEATGQLLAELCSDLAASHRITVIAGQPNCEKFTGSRLIQQENDAGVHIFRLGQGRFSKKNFFARVWGLTCYLFLAAWTAFCQPRPDVLVVLTDPPVLGALGFLLKKWHRCRLVFYLQDLFPETALALGVLRPGFWTWLLHWTTQLGMRNADRIVVLGEDMKKRVLARDVDPAKVVNLPNWADTSLLRPLPANQTHRQAWGINGELAVMYSGNLGLSQNLDQVLAAARELRQDPVVFLLVGEGAAKARLLRQAAHWSLANVRFLPYQPREKLSLSLGAADVHLIPLQRGLAGCVVPCKVYGILAAGIPFIAAVERESDLARLVQQTGTGLLVEPDSPTQLIEAIRWCLHHRTELRTMGKAGRQLAEQYFDRSQAVARFAALLEKIVPHQRSHR